MIEFSARQHVMRTGCYMLKTEAAKTLVKKSNPIRFVLDTLTGTYKIHKLNIIEIIPRVVFWNDEITSEIKNRDTWALKNRKSFKGIIYRLLLKAFRKL